MAIYCDDCDNEFSFLDDVEEVDGEILCHECAESRGEDWADEEDEEEESAGPHQPSIQCQLCLKDTPAKNVITKNPGPMCRRCAHKYELEIWTPPDHLASKCDLCTTH